MSEPSNHHGKWNPAPPDLTIDRAVHIWRAPTDVAHERLDVFEKLLSPEERERMAGFRIPAKRAESIIARGLLRHLLATLLRQQPQQLQFTLGPHGKPALAPTTAATPLQFNVSHTAHCVLIAIAANARIGIDIEKIRPATPCEELSQRFFTANEHAALTLLPEPAKREAFFRCWTRKEALLKAAGHGIAAGLDTFDVPVSPAAAPLHIPATFANETTTWTLFDIHPGLGYVATLAVEDRTITVQHWQSPIFF